MYSKMYTRTLYTLQAYSFDAGFLKAEKVWKHRDNAAPLAHTVQ